MKYLLVFLAVVAAAFFAWKFVFAASPAFQAYESFADALVVGDRELAGQFADGPQVGQVLADRKNRWGYTPRWMEGFHGTKYTVESEKKSSGQVELVVVQNVAYTPPGTESALGGTMSSDFRHNVTVAKKGSEWKVVRFESEHVNTVQGPRG
jgi:hypothetical protein